MEVLLPEPGIYVVAVSGGVDSVALLHLLRNQPGLRLVVAHFDHGMREGSAEDRKFVRDLAQTHGLPFIYDEGRLGIGSSEAAARKARYAFLDKVKNASGAKGVITAHHQDDVLETALLNLLRGTGRKGLSPMQAKVDVVRPLVKIPKADLINYARKNNLAWREDPTNKDVKYLRNYVRHRLMPRFSPEDRAYLIEIIGHQGETNEKADAVLNELIGSQPDGSIGRLWFNQLPHSVSKEMMATWLRANGLRDFDSSALERLVHAAKTASPNQLFPVYNGVTLSVGKDFLALVREER